MILTIPYAPGIKLNERVLSSLNDCGIPFEMNFVCRGLPYSEVKGNRLKWLDNICLSRNACLEIMSAILHRDNEHVAIMNDSHQRQLYVDSIVKAEIFLINNPEYAVVALSEFDLVNTKPGHVKHGCWIFHKRFFTLGLRYTHTEMCECSCMCNAIQKAGMKIKYLDGIKRIEHLR